MLKRSDIRLTILIIILTITLASFGISPISLIGITVVSMLASRWITAPLRQLTQLAETIPNDDKTPPPEISYASNEVAILENTFNALNTRLQNLTNLEEEHAQQLRRDEQRYKIINELISDYAAYVEVDEQGELYNGWMIGAYTEMLGYEVSDTGSHINLAQFVHPEDTSLIDDAIKGVLNNKTTTCVYRARHKDGHYIWMEVIRQPIWNEDEGRVTGFYSSAQNVSDRMEAQQRLTESEQSYQIINDLISDYAAYVRVDEQGELYNGWMIGPYTEMIGFDVPEPGGHINLERFIHPDDYPQVKQAIKQLLNNETTTTVYRALHKDGHFTWLEVTRQPIWDENEGRVTGFYSATRDVSDRMEAQLLLKQSEQRYKRVSDLMSDYAYYIRIDEDGELSNGWITGAYTDILGYDKPPSDTPVNFDAAIHPDDRAEVRVSIQKILNNESTTSTYRGLHKDGHYIWLEVTREPAWDEDEGRVIGFYGAARNVNDRMEAQLNLQENEAWYKQVSELMSDFAYEVVVDKDGSINQHWRGGSDTDILGYEQQTSEAFAKPNTTVHPNDLSIAQQALEQVLNNKRITATYRARHNAGHYIWLEVTRQPIWDGKEERVTGFYGAARDVTERMEAQLRLEKSETRHRQVSELMTDYTFETRVSLDGSLYREWVAGAFKEILGVGIEETLRDAHPSVIHPEDEERYRQTIARVLNNEVVTLTYRVQHQSGHYIWLEVTRRPVWDEEQGRVIRYYGATRDVTERMEAQLRLKEREARYKQVSELMSDYAFSMDVDTDGKLYSSWVTGAYTEILGYDMPASGSFGKLDIIHPDDKEAFEASIQRTLNNEATRISYRIAHKDGHYLWLEVNRQPEWDEKEKRVVGFYGAARDVTKRMEAQLRLTESETRFRSMANTAPIMIWMSDTKQETSYLNDAWLSFTGRSIEEELGHGWRDNIHPDDYEHVMTSSDTGHDDKTPVNIEYRLRRHDGEYRWIRDDSVPLLLENGDYAGFIGTCLDITVQRDAKLELERLVAQKTHDLQEEILLRKQVEVQLTHEHNLLQSTMKTSPTAIFVMDNEGKVKFANDASHQLLPEPDNENEVRMGENPFVYILDADGTPFREENTPFEKAVQSAESLYNQEVTYKNTHGESRTILLNLAPISRNEGAVSEVVITARDITLERETEAQIKAALREEVQLNQIRSRFISTISHEFKSPLTVIQMLCDLVQRSHSKLSKEQLLERFERVEAQGKRLNKLVDDVVKLNQTNSTHYEIQRESMELPKAIVQVAEDALIAYQESVTIEYDFQPDKQAVNQDPTLTHQFLSNLIGNAIKYSNYGTTVHITSHLKETELEIIIKDEGIGIPEEDMPYLFTDFFRASNTGTINGTGLGLVIAKRAVELLGGTISVESVENEGTTFHILLPL